MFTRRFLHPFCIFEIFHKMLREKSIIVQISNCLKNGFLVFLLFFHIKIQIKSTC